MTGMCSIFLLIQLGSLVIVNGYTLDDPEALSNADDVSQEDVMGYLDYLQELRDSNLPSEGGIQKRGYYDDQSVRELMAKRKDFVKRRLCILPTMSCNLRPNYCCPNTTCRCNLWGQNCRCLRMGFFQRWGKRKWENEKHENKKLWIVEYRRYFMIFRDTFLCYDKLSIELGTGKNISMYQWICCSQKKFFFTKYPRRKISNF